MDATGLQIRVWYASLRLLARVVSRVDVVDAARTDELNLEDRLFVPRPNKMRVLCRQREEGTRLQHLAFLFELFTHAGPQATADHGNSLGIGMRVRRNLIVSRQFDALHDHPASFCRVTHQDGELAPFGSAGLSFHVSPAATRCRQ